MVLGDITMHNLDVILDLVRQKKRIGFYLGLTKDNGLAKSSVNKQNISKSLHPVVEWTIDRDMVDILLSSILQILCKINHLPVFPQVVGGQLLDPTWNGGREQKKLWHFFNGFLYVSKNSVNVFFETKFHHLVCFVKNHTLDLTEIKISSFHVVEYSTGSSDKDINTLSELPYLVIY